MRRRRVAVVSVSALVAITALFGLGSASPSAAAPAAAVQSPSVSRDQAIKQLDVVRDSIDRTLELIKDGRATDAFNEAKDGYLSHFELVEVPLRVVDPTLTSDAETKFAEIRGLITDHASTEE